MSPGFMSSEYSCTDSDDENKLVTRRLEWRSAKLSKFFQALDEHYEDSKSPMAKRQTKARCVSSTLSTRGVPADCNLKWAIKPSFLAQNQ